MIIYKMSDRIPIEIGDVKFWVSPLNFEQKTALAAQVKMVSGVEQPDSVKIAYLAVKYSVKEIEGVKSSDGSNYQLEFMGDGALTDECVSELLQLEHSPLLVTACSHLIGAIKDHNIPGVKIDIKSVKSVKKKEA